MAAIFVWEHTQTTGPPLPLGSRSEAEREVPLALCLLLQAETNLTCSVSRGLAASFTSAEKQIKSASGVSTKAHFNDETKRSAWTQVTCLDLQKTDLENHSSDRKCVDISVYRRSRDPPSTNPLAAVQVPHRWSINRTVLTQRLLHVWSVTSQLVLTVKTQGEKLPWPPWNGLSRYWGQNLFKGSVWCGFKLHRHRWWWWPAQLIDWPLKKCCNVWNVLLNNEHLKNCRLTMKCQKISTF